MDVMVPENASLIAYLSQTGPKELLVSPAASTADPYLALGSHPDVVERLWHDLGRSFPTESCQIVCSSPALVHPSTGIVFALAIGTTYVLRFSPEVAKKAREAGFPTVHRWSNSRSTDIERELGVGWVFGKWSPQEISWLKESYGSFEGST